MSSIEDMRAQSEFNMAISWLNRLNYWFYVCDDASHSMNVWDWFHTLLILFRELTTEMKPEEIRQREEKTKELWDRVNIHVRIMQNKPRQAIPKDIYWELHEFEQFLRRTMDKSGLLKKVQDNALMALK